MVSARNPCFDQRSLTGLLIGFIVVKYWEGGRERFY